MTTKQMDLIEDSWDHIIINAAEAGVLFYEKLFELDPGLKPLFKGNIKVQAHKLTSMITYLVHNLNKLEKVENDVRLLGVRHKNYMVKPEYYTTVGTALLWTLEQGLGDQWDSEMSAAWSELYGVLSHIMIEASK